MDFIITKEQQRMQKAAREMLKAKCTQEFVCEMEKDEKGCTSELWRQMGELDWTALIIPEEYDGVGAGFFDLVLMMEELGRACAPGPFFSTVVLGALSLIEFGTPDMKRRWLPKIARADTILTLALSEPQTFQWDPYLISTAATAQGDGYRISGVKLFVPEAHVAEHIICAARTSGLPSDTQGITLFLVNAKEPGIVIQPLKTIAGDKQFEVAFENVSVRATDVIGELNHGGEHLDRILQYAAICKCAEMVGGAGKVLEMSAAYAKERKQFGKPIGSFQAIQHHCANMLIGLEGSRYITYKAAWMLGEKIPCAREVSVAKAWVSDMYRNVVALGHQVQGGSAFMEEHEMPLFSRRAAAAAVAFGDARYHRRVVARALGL
jgi:alkylation response protein AidB-like acyl-CoA dehydrogenase